MSSLVCASSYVPSVITSCTIEWPTYLPTCPFKGDGKFAILRLMLPLTVTPQLLHFSTALAVSHPFPAHNRPPGSCLHLLAAFEAMEQRRTATANCQNLAGLAAAFMSLPPACLHASVALPAYGRLVRVNPTVRSLGPSLLTARSKEAASIAPDLHVNLFFLDCLFLGFL